MTPNVARVEVGQSVVLYCKSSENSTLWFHNSLKSYPLTYYSANFLIKLASSKHEGIYYCYGKYNKKKKHFLAKSTVKVYGEFDKYLLTSINSQKSSKGYFKI